mmetsp:Transcript_5826/g.10121  ORF Transcript_5826/g.10121 Transcript_5826/m.10121 type:complete len:206 (-) Transcript_5826:488-1105(-)
MSNRNTPKKRKHDGPLDDIERTLYASFSSAANGISQLYTQSLNQQRKAYCLGARHISEKLIQWLEDEHRNQQHVSTTVLVALLTRELEEVEGNAAEQISMAVPGTVPSVPPPTQPERTHGCIYANNNGRSARHTSQAEAKQRTKPMFANTLNPHPVHPSQQPHAFSPPSVAANLLDQNIGASHHHEQAAQHSIDPGTNTSPCPME